MDLLSECEHRMSFLMFEEFDECIPLTTASTKVEEGKVEVSLDNDGGRVQSYVKHIYHIFPSPFEWRFRLFVSHPLHLLSVVVGPGS